MLPRTTLLILLLAAAVQLATAVLPYGWKPCKSKSPSFLKCIAGEIEKALNNLKSGDRKLGVQPIDPLLIKKLVVDQRNGPVSVKLTFTDLTFEGLSKSKISLNGDWNKVNTTILLDELVIKGKYKVEGKILTVPIVGEGPCTLLWNNLKIDNIFDMEQYQKSGKMFIRIKTLTFKDIKPQNVHFRFENLFNGNKELGDTMNKLVNENWEVLFNEVKPSILKGLSIAIKSITESVFKNIPANEIIID